MMAAFKASFSRLMDSSSRMMLANANEPEESAKEAIGVVDAAIDDEGSIE